MNELQLEHVNSITFITYYGFESKDALTKFISMVYYTMTTLSTIGFGDYRPWADEERLFQVIIFISGVSIFSYLMGVFIEILKKFQQLNISLDDGDRLSMFFSLMK